MATRTIRSASWKFFLAVAAALLPSAGVGSVRGEDWPEWRGPRGDGASQETGLPLKWSTTEGVVWKRPLADPGNSTPIVHGGKVFLTQAQEKGAKRGLACFSAADGRPLWNCDVEGRTDEPTHATNPLCSSSPATDGERVYAWLGSAGVIASTLDGKLLWKRDLGVFTHIWGFGGSPVLYENLLILNCGPGERAFVVALDKATGKTVWEVPGVTSKADAFKGSWCSPRLVRQGKDSGGDLLLVGQPGRLVAYDPATGKETWSCRGLTDLVYTSPMVGEGAAVAMSGYHGKALAVRLGGAGDVTETHRLWNTADGVKEQQRIGTGVVLDGRVFSLNEPGLECLDLLTGKSLWKKRLGVANWSSILHAEGRLYFVDQAGTTHVVAAKPELEVLSENRLEETTNASIVAADGGLFVRTHRHLWRLGKK